MHQFTKTIIGKPEKWLIKAATSIGLDYSELSHEMTNYFKNHVIKRHGQGVLAIVEKDFERIPAIVKSPDMAIIGAIRDGVLVNIYTKREILTTYLYFEKVMDSNRNKALRGQTFYKIAKRLDMDGLIRIVNMNGKLDVSRAKKIIAAGGHPGEEA